MKKMFALGLALIMALGGLSLTAMGEETRKVVIGVGAELAPFGFVDADGSAGGFDAELMEILMLVLEYDYEIVPMAFDELLPALMSGKIELAAAALPITEERSGEVLFSDAYFHSAQRILTASDSAIGGCADLAGRKVGIHEGTAGDLSAVQGAEMAAYGRIRDAVEDLKAGKLDAVIVNEEAARTLAAREGLKVAEESVSQEAFGIAAARNSGALMGEINRALSVIRGLGYYDALCRHWFGSGK